MADSADAANPMPEQVDAPASPTNSPEPAPAAPAAPVEAPAPLPRANVINPDGDLVSIPSYQLRGALNAGYQKASPEAVAQYAKEQKYGSVGQQVITGLEGAAEGLLGPLAPAAEVAAGVNREDISGRKEINPGEHFATQLGGLTGGALLGTGEGALLGAAGKAATEGLGLAEATSTIGKIGSAAVGQVGATSTLSKIGSAAVGQAVEGALFQAGDEVTKKILQDPEQSASTALTDIGLVGLVSGGLGGMGGAAGQLWHATAGPKLSAALKTFTDRLGGSEGAAAVAPEIDSAIVKSGLEVPGEIRASLSDDPALQNTFKTLQQSDTTKSGRKFQETYNKFRSDANNAVLDSFGKTPEEVANYSEATQGREALNTFKDEFKSKIEPINKVYNEVTEKFKDTPLQEAAFGPSGSNPYLPKPKVVDSIAEKIGQMAEEKGWNSAGTDQNGLLSQVLKRLPKADTIQDLSNLNSFIREQTAGFMNSPLWNVGSELKTIITDAQQEALGAAIGRESPELFAKYMGVKSQYAQFARLSDEMAGQLRLGKSGGPKGFLAALAEKRSPEEFLRALSPKGNAELIPLLEQNFPGTLNKIKENELLQALKPAVLRAKEGEAVSAKTLFSALDKLSPESKKLLISPETGARLEAIRTLTDKLDSLPHNFSNTARTMDKLMEHVPGSAVAVASMAVGHNPAIAAVLGMLTKTLGKDVPDATRLALLKFMGSKAPIEAGGFKSAVDFIHHTMQGQSLISRTLKNVFKAEGEILPASKMPTESDRTRLDKALKSAQKDPQKLMDVASNTGHYLPDHGTAMTAMASGAFNYLSSIKPENSPRAPLDTKQEPSIIQQAAYNRALDIAQQPLIILDKINKGTLIPQDLAHLKSLYPAMYTKLSQGLSAQLADYVDRGKSIPYKQRLSLSLFLGQPLDSTMTPEGIVAAQPKPPQAQQASADQPASGPKHSATALNKLPGMYATQGQTRAAARASGAKA